MRVPILCYHRIEAPPASAPDDSNFVSPELFRRHVALLFSLGFHGVTVNEVARWQRGECQLPRRPIVLSFDDGFESVADHAFPVLRRAGWGATIFAISGCVGRMNEWDPTAPPGRLLDAHALRQLAAEGYEIGSHTRRHRRVTELDAVQAAFELAGARSELQAMTGRAVTSFAFPYGTHSRLALTRVAEAGYSTAVTLKRWGNGRRTNPLRLGRMSVGGALAPWQLGAKLAKLMVTPARA